MSDHTLVARCVFLVSVLSSSSALSQEQNCLDATVAHNRMGRHYVRWSDETYLNWMKVKRQKVRVEDHDGAPVRSTTVRSQVSFHSETDTPNVVNRIVEAETDERGLLSVKYLSRLKLPPMWVKLEEGWRLLERPISQVESDEILICRVAPRNLEFRFEVSGPNGSPLGATIRFQYGATGGDVPWIERHVHKPGIRSVLSGFAWGAWWAIVESEGFAPVRICPYQFRPGDSQKRYTNVVLEPSVKGTVIVDKVEDFTLPIWSRVAYATTGITTETVIWKTVGEVGRVDFDVPKGRECHISICDALGRRRTCVIQTREAIGLVFPSNG